MRFLFAKIYKPLVVWKKNSGAPASSMFVYAFNKCSGLTGASPKINGQYLYEIWPDATNAQVGVMYRGATGPTDYADIPSNWK